MNISEIIKEIKEQYAEYEGDIEVFCTKLNSNDSDKYTVLFEMIKKYRLQPKMVDLLCDALLIEKDESLYAQYELCHIETIRKINLEVNPSDVVILSSYLYGQSLEKEPNELEMHRIDDLIQQLEELKRNLLE